jgi:hypothetical protein
MLCPMEYNEERVGVLQSSEPKMWGSGAEICRNAHIPNIIEGKAALPCRRLSVDISTVPAKNPSGPEKYWTMRLTFFRTQLIIVKPEVKVSVTTGYGITRTTDRGGLV